MATIYSWTFVVISIVILGVMFCGSVSAQETVAPGDDWFEWSMPWSSSVIDLSRFADAPAGKHGALETSGTDFVFADGTPVKFWGTNVVAIACMPEKADAPVLARTMRKRGFNLVRFHYYDSTWAGDPGETTLIDYSQGDSQHWNEDKLDRMFFFINELKKEGVYCMIDANSGRSYPVGDGLPTALETRARGHAIFVERLIELQQDMIQRLFTRENPYTGMAMKDDPAIAILNINNENDCVYGGVKWDVEPYGTEMKQRYLDWAADKGITPEPATIEQINFKPWKRSDSATRFLIEVQTQYQERMGKFCRETVGIRALLTGVNWNMGYFVPMANESMDISDNHIYETHPGSTRDYIPNKRVIGSHELKFHSRNLLKIDTKPYFISEWDHRLPNETRAEYPCFLATQAAFGKWAGLVHFCALSTLEKIDYPKDINNSWGDPAIYGLFPHAALLYYRDVSPANQTIVMKVDPDNIDMMNQTFPAQIKAHEVNDFVVSTKDSPVGDYIVGPDEQAVPADLDPIISDTGEYKRSPENEYMLIDTDGTQVITANFEKSPTLQTSNLEVSSTVDFAVIALSSVEDTSISLSDRLLLTTMARAYATGFTGTVSDGNLYYQNSQLGSAPALLEPVTATVAITLSNAGLSVYTADASGKARRKIPSTYTDGKLTFEVGSHNSMYYMIGLESELLPDVGVEAGTAYYSGTHTDDDFRFVPGDNTGAGDITSITYDGADMTWLTTGETSWSWANAHVTPDDNPAMAPPNGSQTWEFVVTGIDGVPVGDVACVSLYTAGVNDEKLMFAFEPQADGSLNLAWLVGNISEDWGATLKHRIADVTLPLKLTVANAAGTLSATAEYGSTTSDFGGTVQTLTWDVTGLYAQIVIAGPTHPGGETMSLSSITISGDGVADVNEPPGDLCGVVVVTEETSVRVGVPVAFGVEGILCDESDADLTNASVVWSLAEGVGEIDPDSGEYVSDESGSAEISVSVTLYGVTQEDSVAFEVEPNPVISIGSGTASNNDQVYIPVMLSQSAGRIAELGFQLGFDSQVVQVLGVSEGEQTVLAGMTTILEIDGDGNYQVSVTGDGTTLADGEIAVIAVAASQSSADGDCTPLLCQNAVSFDSASYEMETAGEDGQCCVDITVPLGDVDRNEVVNAIDIQLVINRVLGLDVPWNCDTNGDGAVNAPDIQLVINAVLGIA